ncbi:hypothetical protein ACH9EU_08620 [Kocuria sp. M1R5S2]|uniref:hypothetical protein n=1 Tax=Kocuria rhizosphaerae TaxID=3376285 RepID=UPI00378E5991
MIIFRHLLARVMMASLYGMYGEKARIFDGGKGAAHHMLWAGGGWIVLSVILLCAGLFIPPEAF